MVTEEYNERKTTLAAVLSSATGNKKWFGVCQDEPSYTMYNHKALIKKKVVSIKMRGLGNDYEVQPHTGNAK